MPTGTLWLIDRGVGTKPLKLGLSRLKRDVWYAYCHIIGPISCVL